MFLLIFAVRKEKFVSLESGHQVEQNRLFRFRYAGGSKFIAADHDNHCFYDGGVCVCVFKD